jgi:4a-hydroxytetrahydrobiopterin dehydratase
MSKLTEVAINKKLEKLDGWEFHENSIQTKFEFEDFKETFSVMTRIAFEAEAQQHHPEWTNVYNTLSITLTNHDEGGVTEKDFKMAETIEQLIDIH